MLRKIGRSSNVARASASGPHGNQSTGLFACWRRYGLVSPARRLGIIGWYAEWCARAPNEPFGGSETSTRYGAANRRGVPFTAHAGGFHRIVRRFSAALF